ncbi:hypothetical protein ACOME3_004761 [Neoechinorhynchus agilis]
MSSFRSGDEMSFQSSGAQSFEQLYNTVMGYLQKLTNNVNQIERLVGQIGTETDSESLRHTFHQLQRNTNEVAKESNEALQNLVLIKASSVTERAKQHEMKENLARDYMAVMTRFQSAQKLGAEREKASLERIRAAVRGDSLTGEAEDFHGFGGDRQQQLLQVERDISVDLMRERESQIRKLESDIVGINQIFKDVGSLLHEQGYIVDSIERSLDAAQERVEAADTELTQAVQYQSSARKKKIILAIVAIIVLFIIILTLALTLRKS